MAWLLLECCCPATGKGVHVGRNGIDGNMTWSCSLQQGMILSAFFCGECTDIEALMDLTSEVFSCSLPFTFRRKKDMAGPGSGRRARGDCRGEGPAPLIQQPARTSGPAGAAALA